MQINPSELTQEQQCTYEASFGRVCEIINSGATATMISLGHRLKLFSCMAGLDSATSKEIASKANLNERYVKEWLASMVVSRIVDYDDKSEKYHLPIDMMLCLTTNGLGPNLAVYTQFVSMAAQSEDMMIERFKDGQGSNYEDYPCFHSIMSQDNEQSVSNNILQIISKLSPELIKRLEAGIEVVDAGCGRGTTLVALARQFKNSKFYGIDVCEDVINAATNLATEHQLTNLQFTIQDLDTWDEENRYDLVLSFDAIHDMKAPQEVISKSRDALREGGIYFLQEIGGSAHLQNNLEFPFSQLLYAISTVHCTPISIGQGGKGLGTMWGWETAMEMIRKAGFVDTKKYVLEDSPMNVWFISSKS